MTVQEVIDLLSIVARSSTWSGADPKLAAELHEVLSEAYVALTTKARDNSMVLRSLVSERDAARRHASNLLARIHRDGGQHEAEVGTQRAVDEADKLVADLYVERDEARAEVEVWKRRHATTSEMLRLSESAREELRAENERTASELDSFERDDVVHSLVLNCETLAAQRERAISDVGRLRDAAKGVLSAYGYHSSLCYSGGRYEGCVCHPWIRDLREAVDGEPSPAPTAVGPKSPADLTEKP